MNKKVNAKKEAWEKKQEEKGKKVVAWIFGGLIVLAIIYLLWTWIFGGLIVLAIIYLLWTFSMMA